ncbi:MAG: polyprenyl synthetase family protein [Candidatus Lokiarchaeota archaeon]
MIENFINSERKIVNKQLEKYFRSLSKNQNDPLLKDFLDQTKKFMLNERAKRIHPALLVASFNGIINPMYLEDQINDVRKVAMAVEFLHNGQLIQDDLIDDDLIRRDSPTFHIQFKNELEKVDQDKKNFEKSSTLYGRNMGIIGASFAYNLGQDIIKCSKFPKNQKLLAFQEYTEAVDSILKGQIIEDYMEFHRITMSLEQYLNIAEMIRACVFEKSSKIGAIFAKGNIHYQIKPLSEAMLRIGQAMAISDDIIDLKKDIRSKKKKVVYIIALQNTNEAQSKRLKEIYSKKELSENDVNEVENLFKETNALTVSEHLAKNLISQAKNYLNDIYPDLNREQKQFFDEFADFVIKREY